MCTISLILTSGALITEHSACLISGRQHLCRHLTRVWLNLNFTHPALMILKLLRWMISSFTNQYRRFWLQSSVPKPYTRPSTKAEAPFVVSQTVPCFRACHEFRLAQVTRR
ncbi:hypothetical protein BDZ89DRAFT_514860 [Hymenopellis radicata]|nr:hypothetical protein BDZ89DRAFT_514860 [Hymenopellis radicata]